MIYDDCYEKIEGRIKDKGWTIAMMEGDYEKGVPFHMYTVGLTELFNHPEIVLIGIYNKGIETIFEMFVDAIKNNKKVFETHKRYPRYVQDYDVYFIDVLDEYKDLFLATERHYEGKKYDMIQLLLPDTNNKLPFEEGCEKEMAGHQIMLNKLYGEKDEKQ